MLTAIFTHTCNLTPNNPLVYDYVCVMWHSNTCLKKMLVLNDPLFEHYSVQLVCTKMWNSSRYVWK